MLARLHFLWDRLRTSLWAFPLTVSAACAALAFVALELDLPWATEAAWLYSGSATQAPEFAASLVGAMITLTSLAFSITMVVLALAAQQLGPRLIQIFMSDRGTQAALGLFIGTTIYLLLVLRALDGEESGTAPNLAITGGTALVLASVVTLLFFVHSLARSIVADHVIARVGDQLDEAIADSFAQAESEPDEAPPEGGSPVDIKGCGYIQRIDYDALVRALRRCDARIVLNYHAGMHVVNGESMARGIGGEVDALKSALASAVIFASERNLGQDPEWSMRQLVEIALRALSPGINDVYTALAVIDRLTRAMAALMKRAPARTVWRDKEGVARVFGPAPTFALMLRAGFDQIRESGADKQRVVRRLAENLRLLASVADERSAAPLRRQVDLLNSVARRSLAADERSEIDDAIRAARLVLSTIDARQEA